MNVTFVLWISPNSLRMLRDRNCRQRLLMPSRLTCALVLLLSSASCAGGSGDETGRASRDPMAAPSGPTATANSRCSIDPMSGDVACAHESQEIGGRLVVYETPLGAAPNDGWPVVLMLQGSLYGPDKMWAAAAHDALAKFT